MKNTRHACPHVSVLAESVLKYKEAIDRGRLASDAASTNSSNLKTKSTDKSPCGHFDGDETCCLDKDPVSGCVHDTGDVKCCITLAGDAIVNATIDVASVYDMAAGKYAFRTHMSDMINAVPTPKSGMRDARIHRRSLDYKFSVSFSSPSVPSAVSSSASRGAADPSLHLAPCGSTWVLHQHTGVVFEKGDVVECSIGDYSCSKGCGHATRYRGTGAALWRITRDRLIDEDLFYDILGLLRAGLPMGAYFARFNDFGSTASSPTRLPSPSIVIDEFFAWMCRHPELSPDIGLCPLCKTHYRVVIFDSTTNCTRERPEGPPIYKSHETREVPLGSILDEHRSLFQRESHRSAILDEIDGKVDVETSILNQLHPALGKYIEWARDTKIRDEALDFIKLFVMRTSLDQVLRPAFVDKLKLALDAKDLYAVAEESRLVELKELAVAVTTTNITPQPLLDLVAEMARRVSLAVVHAETKTAPTLCTLPVNPATTGINYTGFNPGGHRIRNNLNFGVNDASNNSGTDEGGTCTKHYERSGMVQVAFCEHGRVLGLHTIYKGQAEGPRDPMGALLFCEVAPKFVVYDNACNLAEYTKSRHPSFFADTIFVHDRFHGVNHVACSRVFNADRYPELDFLNSSIAEQFNSFLKVRR